MINAIEVRRQDIMPDPNSRSEIDKDEASANLSFFTIDQFALLERGFLPRLN